MILTLAVLGWLACALGGVAVVLSRRRMLAVLDAALTARDTWKQDYEGAREYGNELTRQLKTAQACLAALETQTVPSAAPVLAGIPMELQTQIQGWIKEQDTRWPERSGEAKRHQVYAAALKAAPDISKRAIARAIEAAL